MRIGSLGILYLYSYTLQGWLFILGDRLIIIQCALKIATYGIPGHFSCFFDCGAKGAYLRDRRHYNVVTTLFNRLKYHRIVVDSRN